MERRQEGAGSVAMSTTPAPSTFRDAPMADNRKSYRDRFIDLRPILDADKTRQELNELYLQNPDKFLMIVRPRWDCVACGAIKPYNEKPDGHWVARCIPPDEGSGIYFVHICDPSCESTGSVNITYPGREPI